MKYIKNKIWHQYKKIHQILTQQTNTEETKIWWILMLQPTCTHIIDKQDQDIITITMIIIR